MRLSICLLGLVAVACSSGLASNDQTDSLPGALSAVELRPAAGALAVMASWRALPDVRVSYAVLRTDQSPARTLGQTTVPSYEVSGLVPGERVCLSVHAQNAAGPGPDSNPVCAAALDVPSSAAGVRVRGTDSGLHVEWDAPRSASAAPAQWTVSAAAAQVIVDAASRSADLTGLTAGVEYEVFVIAVNAAGRSAPASARGTAGLLRPTPPPGSAWTDDAAIPLRVHDAFVGANRLWLVGSDSVSQKMISAPLDASGIPGAWESVGAASFITASGAYPTWTDGSSWLVVGLGPPGGWGMEGSEGHTRSAMLQPDGSGIYWTDHPSFRAGGYRVGGAVSGNHVYAIGGEWWSGGSFSGYGVGVPLVHVADVQPGGSLGPWRDAAPLPQAGATYAATIDGRIYALVQMDTSEFRLFHAVPAADGSIGQWRVAKAHPPRGNYLNALVAESGHLYATGGQDFWVASPSADGDVIRWSSSPGDRLSAYWMQALVGARGHLYAVTSTPSGNYSLRVATIDPSTGHLSPFSPPKVPDAPLSVSADSPAPGNVRISWQAPQGTVTGYEVRDLDAETIRQSLPADARQFTATSLDPLKSARFEVRAVNASGPGPWSTSNFVLPWPSSTWRPVIGLADRYAFLAGNTVFSEGYPAWHVTPLDADGQPWGVIGPHWSSYDVRRVGHEGMASVAVSQRAGCMYLTGGREFSDSPSTTDVTVWCVQDDGFLGEDLPGHTNDAPPSMTISRFDHASVVLGRRVYVLGGAQQDQDRMVTPLADVSSAPIGSDWNPGTWRSTTPLPLAAQDIAAAAGKGRMYAVVPTPGQVRIFLADAHPDESLGAWRETLGIADIRAAVSAIVIGDFLYVLGGGQEPQANVLIGRLDRETGAVLSWNSDLANSFVGQRATPSVIARGNRLYINAGFSTGGQMADIDPASGNLINWR
jgi:hypothetical protein